MIVDALPDIPRFWTGVAEWLACVVAVQAALRWAPRWRRVAVLAAAAPLLVLLQIGIGTLPVDVWMLGMGGAVLAMALVIAAAGRPRPALVAHLTAHAFVLAELTASVHWQLTAWASRGDPTPWGAPTLVLGLLVLVPLALVAWLVERAHFDEEAPPVLAARDVWGSVAIAVVTFAVSNLSFLTVHTPFSARLGAEVFYVRTLVDLCGFVVLHAQQERIREVQVVGELASIEATLRSQHDQYLQSKANLEASGRALHDLRHQIEVLRAEVDPSRALAHFEELDRSVRAIGAQYHCGNPVLDVILTSKATTCLNSDITFTAVADGHLLTGMNSVDIATLFGNALDNAIEASRKVTDPERRIIRLALHARGGMTVIRVENWFEEAPRRGEDGALLTSKPDRQRHGWGVKSIRWTARKYGGEVTTHAEDHWFTLTVLLPNGVRLGEEGR